MEDLRLIVFGTEGPYSRFYHALETLQAQKQSKALGNLSVKERVKKSLLLPSWNEIKTGQTLASWLLPDSWGYGTDDGSQI